MVCQFISIYGKFVTSQTASFSRADIILRSKLTVSKSPWPVLHSWAIVLMSGTAQVKSDGDQERYRLWAYSGFGDFHSPIPWALMNVRSARERFFQNWKWCYLQKIAPIIRTMKLKVVLFSNDWWPWNCSRVLIHY